MSELNLDDLYPYTEVVNAERMASPANQAWHTEGGLTKLEWFAGMAMQGILTGNVEKYTVNGGYLHYESIVKDAYGLAKEMTKPKPPIEGDNK